MKHDHSTGDPQTRGWYYTNGPRLPQICVLDVPCKASVASRAEEVSCARCALVHAYGMSGNGSMAFADVHMLVEDIGPFRSAPVSPAISPQTDSGLPARRAALATRATRRSSAGWRGSYSPASAP